MCQITYPDWPTRNHSLNSDKKEKESQIFKLNESIPDWRLWPPTIGKAERQPDTKEYWEKRALMDLELIIEQKEEIARLKKKLNNLEQKLKGKKCK